MSAIPAWVHGRNIPPAAAIMAIRNPDNDPEARMHLCASLIPLGIIRWTFERLDELRANPALRVRAEQLMVMCRYLWDYDLDGAVVDAIPTPDDVAPNYWLVPAGSDKTLLVFAGTDARLWVSIYLLQRIIEPHGVNVIYLFDPAHAYYMGGIGGRCGGYQETLEMIGMTAGAIGTRKLYCFGNSSGGYGALRYALDLGAEAVLTLSPVIHQLTQPRRIEELNAKLSTDFCADDLNLRKIYAAHCDAGKKIPKSIIACGGENRSDMKSAAMLTGFPGVDHRVVNGIRAHNVMGALIARYQVKPLFSELFDS